MEQHARSGRDTRLLVVTIAVSIVMLLVLARFRFPAQPAPVVEPPPQPLERLAARATYDELTTILRDVDTRVSDTVAGVTIAVSDNQNTGPVAEARVQTVAVRLPDGRAIALTHPGQPIDRAAGTGVTLVASDAHRGVSLLDVAGPAGPVPDVVDPSTIEDPGYLAAIENTPAGLAVRPVYFGRVDRVPEPGWSDHVLRFTSLQQLLPVGAAIFTLRGEFVGLGIPDGRELLVVPAQALWRAADDLAKSGSRTLADPGFQVQPLDATLRAATGVNDGVIIRDVAPNGPSANVLQVGDVITGIGDLLVHNPDDYRAAALDMVSGHAVTIRFVRGGQAATADITPDAAHPSAPPASQQLGLSLRRIGSGSEVVRVDEGSVGARAGLVRGDVITTLNGAAHPEPAAITAAFRRLHSGAWLLIAIDRRGTALVSALGKP